MLHNQLNNTKTENISEPKTPKEMFQLACPVIVKAVPTLHSCPF